MVKPSNELFSDSDITDMVAYMGRLSTPLRAILRVVMGHDTPYAMSVSDIGYTLLRYCDMSVPTDDIKRAMGEFAQKGIVYEVRKHGGDIKGVKLLGVRPTTCGLIAFTETSERASLNG